MAGTITGQIGPGLLVLAGCAPTDDEAALAWAGAQAGQSAHFQRR
ncbi:MAG: hypothetical protein WKG07_06135 [Hymenobacter sp.]